MSAGKGSKQRPTDLNVFRENHDRIFGSRTTTPEGPADEIERLARRTQTSENSAAGDGCGVSSCSESSSSSEGIKLTRHVVQARIGEDGEKYITDPTTGLERKVVIDAEPFHYQIGNLSSRDCVVAGQRVRSEPGGLA
jgi:hypothetical protein